MNVYTYVQVKTEMMGPRPDGARDIGDGGGAEDGTLPSGVALPPHLAMQKLGGWGFIIRCTFYLNNWLTLCIVCLR